MSSSEEGGASTTQKKYKGVRRRTWGKWVSEIRVPGTRDRLWLGSYSTAEAAAVAHDIAFFCLRGSSSTLPRNLNFPLSLPASLRTDMSPRSIQKAASDAGMAIDAQLALKRSSDNDTTANESGVIHGTQRHICEDEDDNYGSWEASEFREGEALNISIEDYL